MLGVIPVEYHYMNRRNQLYGLVLEDVDYRYRIGGEPPILEWKYGKAFLQVFFLQPTVIYVFNDVFKNTVIRRCFTNILVSDRHSH